MRFRASDTIIDKMLKNFLFEMKIYITHPKAGT